MAFWQNFDLKRIDDGRKQCVKVLPAFWWKISISKELMTVENRMANCLKPLQTFCIFNIRQLYYLELLMMIVEKNANLNWKDGNMSGDFDTGRC